MSTSTIGFLRALGMAVIYAVLVFIGDQTHLAFLSPNVAAVVSYVALWLDHALEQGTGKALLGSTYAA